VFQLLGPGFVPEPEGQIVWQQVSFNDANDGLGRSGLGTTGASARRLALQMDHQRRRGAGVAAFTWSRMSGATSAPPIHDFRHRPGRLLEDAAGVYRRSLRQDSSRPHPPCPGRLPAFPTEVPTPGRWIRSGRAKVVAPTTRMPDLSPILSNPIRWRQPRRPRTDARTRRTDVSQVRRGIDKPRPVTEAFA